MAERIAHHQRVAIAFVECLEMPGETVAQLLAAVVAALAYAGNGDVLVNLGGSGDAAWPSALTGLT